MSPEQSPVAHVEHLARDRDGHVVTEEQAWSALWALLIGFFMILVDTSIVTTALPATIRVEINSCHDIRVAPRSLPVNTFSG